MPHWDSMKTDKPALVGRMGSILISLGLVAVLMATVALMATAGRTRSPHIASIEVFEFSDKEPGCSSYLRIEAPGLVIVNAIVDADPANCDLYVEFEFERYSSADAYGTSTSACGDSRGDGGASAFSGKGSSQEFATGCADDDRT